MKPKRQGRPPVIENARDRILDDAAHLFAREGYEGTSLGDVADAIGATKAAIYHYFPNKKDIYEAIIVRTLEGLLRSVSAATAQAAGPEEKLARFMTAHADFFENNYDGFLAMLVGYGGMQNVVMIAEAQRLRDSYEHALRQIITDGIVQGVFRQVDAKVTSRAVLSMLNWMVRWFKPGKDRRAASFAQEYCDLMLGGIRN
ncbi:TetR/AcrR family transcriptional regulator [Chelatococcus asaccharovorans]|uniref:TetR family transcriptional regulator n=1 Tax=Chelatococcus asaccharovorans TaxID=28210 RepID=A0A2V3U6U7_9HYPH|nr:TetR/AcrR family transcriptional regulator [Chelatococcus asaccharovorans]MBS7703675.1 TetR family transcriptional regulator [Chelatococcus asaccharovorans]PXW57832.1 TetR family transcriptional regulator [Chelatococcus asaccharovorans]CAH1669081.1 TetR family transcriptional regulator [Chelatococcus asaccharovorans]CAH1679498.1 TetR family transcriptional regulator [Chelatococcus asaccharovorans]